MKMRSLGSRVLACSAFIISCSQLPTTPDDLLVNFRITPATARPGDTIEAEIVITNPTDRRVTLSSGSSCVATLEALKDDQRIDLEGTAFQCLTVVSYFQIEPHQRLVLTFPLVAMLGNTKPPWGYTDRPPSGVYRIKARMQVGLTDRAANLQIVE